MRLAILDLGTNTFHLLITEVRARKVKTLVKRQITVKLGEGAIQENRIAKIPFRRGINAILSLGELIKKFKADKVVAYATSAIRSSENGIDFVEAVEKKAGIRIHVISGEEEAELICYGVRQCVKLREPALIMDIGGGSIEFIIADHQKIFWKKSYNLGAARLIGTFRVSDPIKEGEIDTLHRHLKKSLVTLRGAVKRYPVKKLIGSAGSFESFAEMSGYLFHGKSIAGGRNSYKFDLDEFRSLCREIINSTTAKRLRMKGLVKMRVEMIVVAALCTEFILNNFPVNEMHLSKYSLKEGALWKEILRLK